MIRVVGRAEEVPILSFMCCGYGVRLHSRQIRSPLSELSGSTSTLFCLIVLIIKNN